ncbi:MAG: ArnT family glycosyltransferase [Chthoniobacterales bacterium]
MAEDANAQESTRSDVTGWRSLSRNPLWAVVAWVLFIKLTLFGLIAAAVPALADRATPWWKLLNQWDAQRYLAIARDGYVANGPERFYLVGFPFYPWMVRAVSWLGFSIPWAALVVSGMASIAAGWWLYRLTREDEAETTSRLAVWFLFIFPTSYFLHIAYTEATLLALAVGSFLAARKERWALAGMLAGLAALTRMNGLILLPALMVEAWLQYRACRRFDWRWLWLFGVPCGFGVYLWVNYHVTGDALAFTKLMDEKFYRALAPPWVGAQSLWESLQTSSARDYVTVGVAEMVFTVLGLVFTIWSWCVLRASYSVWMTGNFLLSVCSTYVLSVPRYTLLMFPIFILFARWSRHRPGWFVGLTTWSLLLLALFSIKCAFGHWAF